jgi:hypothetical protein
VAGRRVHAQALAGHDQHARLGGRIGSDARIDVDRRIHRPDIREYGPASLRHKGSARAGRRTGGHLQAIGRERLRLAKVNLAAEAAAGEPQAKELESQHRHG